MLALRTRQAGPESNDDTFICDVQHAPSSYNILRSQYFIHFARTNKKYDDDVDDGDMMLMLVHFDNII